MLDSLEKLILKPEAEMERIFQSRSGSRKMLAVISGGVALNAAFIWLFWFSSPTSPVVASLDGVVHIKNFALFRDILSSIAGLLFVLIPFVAVRRAVRVWRAKDRSPWPHVGVSVAGLLLSTMILLPMVPYWLGPVIMDMKGYQRCADEDVFVMHETRRSIGHGYRAEAYIPDEVAAGRPCAAPEEVRTEDLPKLYIRHLEDQS